MNIVKIGNENVSYQNRYGIEEYLGNRSFKISELITILYHKRHHLAVL